MDSPVAIIFSELSGIFGLRPAEICALACTCTSARACAARAVTKFTHKSSFARKSISDLWSYCYTNGDRFIVTDTYMAKIYFTETLHRLCLEGVKYTLLTIKCGATEFNMRAEKSNQEFILSIIEAAGARLALSSEWAADDHVVVVHGRFYALQADPFTLAPEYIRDYVNSYMIRVYRRNNW